MKISFNPLTNRQVADSHFTHWTISEEEIIARVREAWLQGVAVDYVGEVEDAYDTAKPLVLSIPPAAFYSPMVKLEAGDNLIGKHEARYGQDEEPRTSMKVLRPGAQKLPAGKVEVVLYSHELLLTSDDASSDADWEIITIDASADGCPIHYDTLIRNHLGLSGGTDHGLSDSEFVEVLRRSFPFHTTHAQLAPAPKE